MNLSSLVHAGRHQAEQQQFQPYPNRPQQMMSSSLVANPYNTAQPISQNPSYSYVTAPQPPPSPPVDETSKCSLPSISSLLGLADGSSPQEQAQQPTPQQSGKRRISNVGWKCHAHILRTTISQERIQTRFSKSTPVATATIWPISCHEHSQCSPTNPTNASRVIRWSPISRCWI